MVRLEPFRLAVRRVHALPRSSPMDVVRPYMRDSRSASRCSASPRHIRRRQGDLRAFADSRESSTPRAPIATISSTTSSCGTLRPSRHENRSATRRSSPSPIARQHDIAVLARAESCPHRRCLAARCSRPARRASRPSSRAENISKSAPGIDTLREMMYDDPAWKRRVRPSSSVRSNRCPPPCGVTSTSRIRRRRVCR